MIKDSTARRLSTKKGEVVGISVLVVSATWTGNVRMSLWEVSVRALGNQTTDLAYQRCV